MTEAPQVFIVDDDPAVRDAISLWLECQGYTSRCFDDAEDFLSHYQPLMRGCIIADIRMPRMNGIELQAQLNQRKCLLPLIFITGHGTVPMAVEAMRHGALDYLRKPLDEQQLLQTIARAFVIDQTESEQQRANLALQVQLNSLTKRELQVATLVVDGLANKIIAANLNISERTVEVHRSNVMHKLQAKTLPQLVKTFVAASS